MTFIGVTAYVKRLSYSAVREQIDPSTDSVSWRNNFVLKFGMSEREEIVLITFLFELSGLSGVER
jgi:hypothetical protein